ncbi:uncharacterized protein LOC108834382 [Raphanus sativus]|uniref:Uncharacterized protein LOC108834382 n=1 Tax=Raphanus sativus TaxID=3726 RepID=A0A6J0LT65_RAPSA|nr:uncharacterized protein LOC108834382 [Raphanus sativus]
MLVAWRALVWFSQAVPRHSFMTWLAFKNRLSTAGRLFGPVITPDWDDTIASLLQTGRNRIDSVLMRMAFQTVLYAIWRERNTRRHGEAGITVEKFTRAIDKQIRNRISSLRYSPGHPLEDLRRRWFQLSS